MRKLTVKNFSVIQEAELEFGKITVLIGPQASGKSLLCRLAFFFSQYLPEFANNVARRHPSFRELTDIIQTRFANWFPNVTWNSQRAQIDYESDAYSISVSIEPLKNGPQFKFSGGFSSDYEIWMASEREEKDEVVGDRLPSRPYAQNGSIYIPSGRTFYSTPNKGLVSVSLKQLDWITQRFSTELDFEYRAMIASSHESGGLLHEFGEQATRILRGRVVSSNGGLQFQQASDSRILQFEFLSSGTLELLPLLNPVSKLIARASIPDYFGESESRAGDIFIEEPESGIFPRSQYDLVRLLAWISNDPVLDQGLVITTHSPYILSSFNNLLEAWQTGHMDEERAKAVRAVIDEKYWVNPDEFRAYAIKDGVLTSIIADDTRLISENYLDSVSETIGAEFDALLRIGYVEA